MSEHVLGRTKSKGNPFFSVFGLLIGVLVILPIFYSIFSGFMPDTERLLYPPRFFPSSLYLENYRHILFDTPIPRFMLNSVVVAVIGTVFRVIVASLAAFAFANLEFFAKKFLFFFILFTMLVPGETIIIQNYLTVRSLGLVNTYMGMAILNVLSAAHIFIMRQSFMTISKHIREAAYMDGCNNFYYYLFMAMPVSKPIIASIGIATFVDYWNAYLWPLLITTREQMRPVQVGITLMRYPDMISNAGLLAGVTVAMVPTIIVLIVSQRNLVNGIAAGSITG